MYLHKENRELFRDAILLASQKLEVSEDIVEKDYYVTLILKKLSTIEYPIVFKGGTSLSKAFHVIDRFSEDIDITFTEHLGEARRKKLKYDILKPIADELGLVIRNFDSPEYFLDYREELDPTTRWSDRLQSSSGQAGFGKSRLCQNG